MRDVTVGVPATGLCYRETLVDSQPEGVASLEDKPLRANPWRGLLWIILTVLVLVWSFW